MVENQDLKQCSRCHSNILLQFYETNRRGELFKTCNNCRGINRENYHRYRENNHEQEKERSRQYRQENINILREKDGVRDALRAEERKQIVQCQCGASLTIGNLRAHEKKDKHLRWMMRLSHHNEDDKGQ